MSFEIWVVNKRSKMQFKFLGLKDFLSAHTRKRETKMLTNYLKLISEKPTIFSPVSSI